MRRVWARTSRSSVHLLSRREVTKAEEVGMGRVRANDYLLTSINWRALFIAASCRIWFIMAALSGEPARLFPLKLSIVQDFNGGNLDLRK